jgi:hypothetical protein
MRLEFLAEGSRDCPLIRLYAFAPAAVLKLRELINSLAASQTQTVSLDEQLWIDPIADLKLQFCLEPRDKGIVSIGTGKFKCTLSPEGRLEMADLLAPLSEETRAEGYQWLNCDGDVALLISYDGKW